MKYSVIYPDPPWYYAKRKKGSRFGAGVWGQYKPMKDQELLDMAPLMNELAAKNCLMPMWATGARMDFAIELAEAWGFRYCTMGWVWVKVKKDPPICEHCGVEDKQICKLPGTYTSQSCEFLMLFAKGSIPPPTEKLTINTILLPRREAHRKPDFFRNEIMRLWPDGPHLEMFARQKTEGWAVWGNETDKF